MKKVILVALAVVMLAAAGIQPALGVFLKYKAGNFFVGAGLLLPIWLESGDSDVGNVMPKINVGYNFGKLKLTGYFLSITESGAGFLKYNYIGATLGYRF